MASTQRASQAIRDTLSRFRTPQYVCRTCRNHLESNSRQIRQQSTLVSARSSSFSNRKTRISNGQVASYATKSRRDYILPEQSLAADDTLSTDGSGYVEARTWDGLEHVGHQGYWKDLPEKEEDKFTPWLELPDTTAPERTELLAYLYIAVVDCLALKQTGGNPQDVFTDGAPDLGPDVTSLKVRLSPSGALSHLEDPNGILQRVSSPEQSPEGSDSEAVEFSIPEIEEQLSGAMLDFKDPLTFQVLKRFSQLSRHRIPDPVLNTVIRGNKPLPDFIDLLAQSLKPKPKKMADVLIGKQQKALDFAATHMESQQAAANSITSTEATKKMRSPRPLGPNVMILSRRETPVDKEKEVGRWKVIERELRARGLPVLGHKNLVSQSEQWNKTASNLRA